MTNCPICNGGEVFGNGHRGCVAGFIATDEYAELKRSRSNDPRLQYVADYFAKQSQEEMEATRLARAQQTIVNEIAPIVDRLKNVLGVDCEFELKVCPAQSH